MDHEDTGGPENKPLCWKELKQLHATSVRCSFVAITLTTVIRMKGRERGHTLEVFHLS